MLQRSLQYGFCTTFSDDHVQQMTKPMEYRNFNILIYETDFEAADLLFPIQLDFFTYVKYFGMCWTKRFPHVYLLVHWIFLHAFNTYLFCAIENNKMADLAFKHATEMNHFYLLYELLK